MTLPGEMPRFAKPTRNDSRAHVWFLNTADDHPEAVRVHTILDVHYNVETVEGSVDIALAREPEGWRVVLAGMNHHRDPETADCRGQVIGYLRAEGVPVAH